MHDPDLDALARRARKAQRLPRGATCESCGTTSHVAVRPDGRLLCYACLLRETGRSGVEEDHLAGRRNLGGLVVRLDANAHREVSELRLQLGLGDWPDADGDPLRVLAHFLGGLATLLVVLARWLHALADDAAGRLGPTGWEGAAPAPVAL